MGDITGGTINISSGNFKVESNGRVSFQNDKIYINPSDSITVNGVTFSGSLLRINSGSNIVVNASLDGSSG